MMGVQGNAIKMYVCSLCMYVCVTQISRTHCSRTVGRTAIAVPLVNYCLARFLKAMLQRIKY